MDFFMTFLAYLHTFLHPLFLWFLWIFRRDGFLHEWQELAGAFMGTFLPLFFGFLAYFLRRIYERNEKKKNDLKEKNERIEEDRKEAFRRAEISFSLALHHIYTTVEQLEEFIVRVNGIIARIEKITDDVSYSLDETNFPPTIDIQFDIELTRMKFKSYYLHNKIIGIEYVIRWANSTITQFREDYQKLIKKNEFMITISLTKTIPTKTQRANYVQLLTGFVAMMEKFLNNLKCENVKSILQAKIYNLKLLADFEKNKKIYEGESDKDTDIIDRVNALLEPEVQKMISEIEI